MSALLYLLRTRIKNRIRALLKSPGGLLGLLLFALLLVLVLVSGNQGNAGGESFRDMAELKAGALLLYAVVFVLIAKNGLGKGASLFAMADVNLLFPSPLESRSILFYGLVRQLGTSLLMGLFLLFQYAWMRGVYGVNLLFILALILGYSLTVFCAQLTAMVIYMLVSGSDPRKRAATAGMVLVTGAAALYMVLSAYLGRADVLGAAVKAAGRMPMLLFPVAGWMAAMVRALSAGQPLWALAALAAVLGYIALMARLLTSLRSDYYEDVLKATEATFTALAAAKEGKVSEMLPANVRVGKTGLGRGVGAGAFYAKHRLEARRARRFILDPMSLVMLAMTLVYALFMRDMGLLPTYAFAMYLMFFTVSTGRWVRELLYPYVYLVPEPPFVKLLHCLRETLLRMAVEAALLVLCLVPILGLTPLEGAAFALSRLGFGVLFTAGLLMVERLFAGITAKWLALLVTILAELVLILPGIVLGVWISLAAPDFLTENLRMLLLPTAMNLPIALLCVFASRNVLQTAEMNHR